MKTQIKSTKNEYVRKYEMNSQNLKLLLLFVFFVSFRFSVISQNIGINPTGALPNSSAGLDVDFTNKGLLIPRVTFAQRTGVSFNPLPAPAQGLMVYQTDAGGDGEGFYYNTSTTTTPNWVYLSSIGPIGPTGPQGPIGLTGPAGPAGPVGCGSANYVIKSDGTSAVCSQIFDNGTNVGIGTAGPGKKLEVTGDIKLSSAGYQIYIGENVTTAAKIGINFHTDADPNYWIGKPAGAWTQPLHIGFYTGVKIGANSAYGGTKFYNSSDMATEIMSVGNGDNHVRVANYLFAQYLNSTDNAVGSGVTGVMVKAGDNYFRTGDASAIKTFLNGNGNGWIENQFAGAQAANHWISGSSRAGEVYAANWFRNDGTGTGLYNQTTGAGIYSPGAGLMSTYNSSSLQIEGASNGSGNLRFTAANPYIVSSSYYICPGGAYFNSGTVYTEAQYQCRGGIHNDANTYLTIAGGTSAFSYFSGNVGIGTTAPGYNLEIVAGTAGGAHVISGRLLDNWNDAQGILEIDASAAYLPSIVLHWPGWYAPQLSLLNNGGIVAMNSVGSDGVPFYAQSFNIWSDISVKKDIYTLEKNDYEQCLNNIMQIRSIKYRYNNESDMDGKKDGSAFRKYQHLGVEAQSLPDEVYSELLNATSTGNGKDGLNFRGYGLGDMDGLLIAGIKAINLNQIEMQEKIDEQYKTLEEQRILIEAMQKEINLLKKKQ